MFKIQIRNLQRRQVNQRFLRKIISQTLKSESASEDKEVSLALVSNKEISKLNERFRGARRTTDVLAFPLGGEFVSTKNLLGEVVISVDKAEEQARRERHSLKNELALLTVHGVLHLLGYTDKEKEKKEVMRDKEGQILHSLGIEVNLREERR
ncbi:rRNA maturation RNase YbeY [Candidatus Aerophobetes bacterium]|uniref:Endoribonuclease YbeY n=1 Tax=Aerophobetes bacterium TaxID=2030807 RepID=A0A523RV05_UNCAE|nr:MAG: rRNA maturation RNase YbeY [Candidatus Aerophobetes bacterium]